MSPTTGEAHWTPHPVGQRLAVWLPVRNDRSEQAVCFVVEARREEQRVRACARRRGGKAESPQPVDHDRAAAGRAEMALELATRRVVGVDPAVAEVADQDVAAERAEGRRRK